MSVLILLRVHLHHLKAHLYETPERPFQHFIQVADELVGVKLKKVCCRRLPIWGMKCKNYSRRIQHSCRGQNMVAKDWL